MPTSCQDATARLMELLYGELPESERASIDGHVAECGRCRAELEGFQRARAVARQVLDDAPPARARDAILRAAAAAAAEVRATPPGARAAARATDAAARVAESGERPRAPAANRGSERPSFWASLRGRWTLPTLATVGAVAVFVLGSRLFMDPAKTYERGREALAPAPRLETAPSPPPGPAAAGPAGIADKGLAGLSDAPAVSDRAAADDRVSAAAAQKSASTDEAIARRDVGEKRKREQHPREEARREALKDAEQEGLAGVVGRSGGSADLGVGRLGGVGSGIASAATANDRFAPPPPPRARSEAKPEKKTAHLEPRGLDQIAEEPATSAPPSSKFAPAPAPERAAAKHKAKADDVLGNFAPAEKPKSPAKRDLSLDALASDGDSKGPAPTAAASAPAAEGAAPSARGKSGRSSATASTETLRERADRLFADGRWNEAAAAYRELLRTEPKNPDAKRWRQRLAVAVQAEGEAQARPAAKAAARPAADAHPTH